MSIRIRFMIVIGILSLLATLGIAVASYQFSVNNAMDEAKSKGHLVFDYLQSSRLYFKKHQRPKIFELAGRDTFIPDIMSGFALTRGVWNEFQKRNSDYAFKQATIDPLHQDNKADKYDMTIIDKFSKDMDLKRDEGQIEKNGSAYYYYAEPIKVSRGCLRCHGDPANAPQEQIDLYGTENGYHWEEGTVASAYVIYVPLQNALNEAKKDAINLVAIGAAGVLVIMLIIWIFFSWYVVKPVSMLEKRATEISLGKNLSEPIITPSQDEIGTLARAVDRLRISVEKMLQRFQK
jgi:methyl-accepting chemotaxis protein